MENKNICPECQREHAEKKVCVCGACMYKNTKQVPDPVYPIVECKRCGRIHFWD